MAQADPNEEELYDAYLDACLSDAPPTPAAFLEGRGAVSGDLRERLEAAHALRKEPVARESREGALPFERLGGYRISGRLGLGGMGSVYLAEQESLGRTVALKVIRSELRASETILRRFEREARAVARLRHPNIVNVYEFGRDDEWDYIAMELVPGEPLDAVLRDSPPDADTILAWSVQLARALAHAHDQGIVHRDVKPQNVMITPAGRPVLLDFGLARMTGTEVTKLTHEFAGTPQYAAPEQLIDDGDGVDGRTDIYALGVTLYEALTGRLPYEGGRLDELLLRILREEPVPPRRVNPAISIDVETVLMKMMEKDPTRRYATGWTAAEDLQRVLDVRPIQARRPGALAVTRKWIRRRPVIATMLAAVVLALVAVGAVGVRGVLADREDARGKVREARSLVTELREARLTIRPEEDKLRGERMALGTRWHEPAELAAFEARLDAVEAHRRDREARFYRVLDLLGEAERLYPGVAGVKEARAALILERVEAARTAGDTPLEAHYRRELTRLDPGGATRAALESRGTVAVTTQPPGASIHLFQFRTLRELVPGGDRRLVPAPVLPAGLDPHPALQPGAHALRVTRAAGTLQAGDLILSIVGQPVHGTVFAAADGEVIRRGDRVTHVDGRPVTSLWHVESGRLVEARALTCEHDGRDYEVLAADRDVAFTDAASLAFQGGLPARVFHDGAVRDVDLPGGLWVRPTAAPRYLVEGARVGVTPLPARLVLPAGSYVLVLRREGYEEVVLPVSLAAGQAVAPRVALLPKGTTPPGFAYVPGNAGVGDGSVRPEGDHAFWMQEREVTVAEYVTFLNDRPGWHASGAVREYVDVAPPTFMPAFALRQLQNRYVTATSDGRFAAAGAHVGSLPVVAVTWQEARAYARWRSLRDGRVYGLPSLDEWMRASGGDGRIYPFGNDFRPGWARTMVSRPGPPGTQEFEPAGRYPIDESPLGVYGMAGNAAEWLDRARGQASFGRKHYAGGSANDSAAVFFRLDGGRGALQDEALDHVGFRLALRSLEPPR